MYFFPNAISLIKKYEAYWETAQQIGPVEDDLYRIGYGIENYPDGTAVKFGQKITRRKADEYLSWQVQNIAAWLDNCKLSINEDQREALISFVHSVGTDVFEDSMMFALVEDGKHLQAAEEFTRWIYDEGSYASPLLIERRRHEKLLFLSNLVEWDDFHSPLLLDCFKDYRGLVQQDMAINFLEQKLDPYLLAEFFNLFQQELQVPMGCQEMLPESTTKASSVVFNIHGV